MKIKDYPTSIRPREKLSTQGAESLSTQELIAIILSSGTKGKSSLEVAEEVLRKGGESFMNLSIENLCSIKGLGKVKAVQLKASFELGLRHSSYSHKKITINSSKEAYIVLHEYCFKKQEHLLLLCLNGRNQLLTKKVITIGTLNASLFHPREIFVEAISDRSSKIIVAHNHPSGSLEPSPQDILMTQKLREASKILDITLVDSLILTEEGYFSIQ